MNSEDEQNLKEKTDSPSRIRRKSKSAQKITDEGKKSKNRYLKREKSYKVGNYLIYLNDDKVKKLDTWCYISALFCEIFITIFEIRLVL